jgi:hypothetical protein
MTRHNPSVLLVKNDDQSELIEQKLATICKNLLERPVDRRGPFSISDNEIKIRLPFSKQLKLA